MRYKYFWSENRQHGSHTQLTLSAMAKAIDWLCLPTPSHVRLHFFFLSRTQFGVHIIFGSVMILSYKINTQTMTDILPYFVRNKIKWFYSLHWPKLDRTVCFKTNWYWIFVFDVSFGLQHNRFSRWNENKPWCVCLLCEIH